MPDESSRVNNVVDAVCETPGNQVISGGYTINKRGPIVLSSFPTSDLRAWRVVVVDESGDGDYLIRVYAICADTD